MTNHLPRRSSIAIPHAHEIHIEHFQDILIRDLQCGGDLCDPGVGDHDVQGPEFGDGFGYHGCDGRGGSYVADHPDGGVGAVFGVEVRDEGVDAGFVRGDVVDAYGVVFGGEAPGYGFAAGVAGLGQIGSLGCDGEVGGEGIGGLLTFHGWSR